MTIRKFNGNTYSEFAVVAAEPLPVDIQGATLTLDANGIEIKNDSGNPVPVIGPLTDSQLRAAAVPVAPNVQQGSGAVTATTQRVTLATDGPGVSALSSIAGLTIPAHDYIALTYTGTNLTEVQYRTGGASGTIVGTLTLAYSGSNLISVTKS